MPSESERQSSLRLLASWSPADPVPADLTQERTAALIVAQRASLAPTEAKAFAVLIERLFAFARTFGIANPDAAEATRFYRDTLGDLPPDLLERAIATICRDWKWGHKLPLPADVRAAVVDELVRRKVTLGRLEVVAAKLDPVTALPKPAEPARRRDVGPMVAAAVKPVAQPGPASEQREAAWRRDRRRMLDDMAKDPDFARVLP